jgi:hypothetical protein
MSTCKTLDIAAIFKSDASDIIKSREDAIRIHGSGDIKAAGNQVEQAIRDYFKRILPSTYYVTHGHLIDKNGIVSPQLDIIISDTKNLPSLQRAKDGTEYVPIESVYAIGEIKSTFYKSKNYIQSFSDVLKGIYQEMHRDNVAFMSNPFMSINMGSPNKIYSFMLFVDKGNFKFEDVAKTYITNDNSYLPATTILLNAGVVSYCKLPSDGVEYVEYTQYPWQESGENWDWRFVEYCGYPDSNGSLEGNHLAFLYRNILEHINKSLLNKPDLSGYAKNVIITKMSSIENAKDCHNLVEAT